jgi:PqqD family protein of HPr-rel-A system
MIKLKKNIALSESGFIFDPATGDSFSVNQTGSKIIEFLKEGLSEDQIIDSLNETFNSDKEQLQKDLDDFLHHLKQLKMIENV